MIIRRTIEETRAFLREARREGRVVGLVPTMGALHEGHGELLRRGRGECDVLVASIFVNPTQFNDPNDLLKYPRTPEADHAMCEACGVELVFEPSEAEMYPRGRVGTTVEVPGLSEILEGAQRPGHFRGVTTVVAKLFEIVRPDVAVFGQKDYQQLAIIRRMVEDLDMGVRLVGVETVREGDGLAMSSRNRRLEPEMRRAATVLRRALLAGEAAVEGGERLAGRVRQLVASAVESEGRARLGYAEVVDAESLAEVERLEPGRAAVVLLAATFGDVRLIDNTVLRP